MENPIKQIHTFNEKAGLLGKPYNPRLEAAFLIEEALEGFNLDQIGISLFGADTGTGLSAKEIARNILKADTSTVSIPAVDALDKACDAIVYAVGSIAKLGLDVQGITKALNIVMTANQAKLKGATFDAQGKLLKNTDFVGPEEKLAALLAEKGL